MYRYKINNSYTVYVFNEYISDCIKVGKQYPKSKKPLARPTYREPVLLPPPNTRVYHKRWGDGILVASDQRGIITISFADRQVRFIYPDAFRQGHLVRT